VYIEERNYNKNITFRKESFLLWLSCHCCENGKVNIIHLFDILISAKKLLRPSWEENKGCGEKVLLLCYFFGINDDAMYFQCNERIVAMIQSWGRMEWKI
jgi:hypothetical protein